MNRTNYAKGLVLYPLLILVSVLVLFPVVWMTYSAFKSNSAIFDDVFALPTTLYLENFTTVFTAGGMATFFKNSAIVTFISVAGLVALSSLAAYAFASIEFRGKTLLFLFFLVGLMVPPQALIISGFTWISSLNMLNTYYALIFTYFGWTSLGILVLRNFFESVPREITDAAKVDGAGHWHMFRHIMVPLSRPSTATIAIFYFMWVWNDFIYPLVYMQEESMYTVPLGILFLNGRYNVEWGLQMAGLTVATLIPMLVYYIFQKEFIRGILAGALKG